MPARSIPAVVYINADRLRTQAMHAWAELFRELEVIVGEAPILALGHAYQGATDFHRRLPALRG